MLEENKELKKHVELLKVQLPPPAIWEHSGDSISTLEDYLVYKWFRSVSECTTNYSFIFPLVIDVEPKRIRSWTLQMQKWKPPSLRSKIFNMRYVKL